MKLSKLIKPYYYELAFRYYFHKYLAPYRQVIDCHDGLDETLIREWVHRLPQYEKVVTIAGGPSAVNVKRSSRYLHVATNASFELVDGFPYVYFLSDGFYVYRYLKKGLPENNWLGTIVREEVCSGSEAVKQVTRDIMAYKKRFKRTQPEMLATDFQDKGAFRDNYEELENFIREHLGMKFKQFNSGFGLVQIAYYLAVKRQVPLEIYGLDAGLGGLVHFDGTEIKSKAVSGDRVRNKLAILLQSLNEQKSVEVINHSYFKVG